jgi:excisionase family DNA binding protein
MKISINLEDFLESLRKEIITELQKLTAASKAPEDELLTIAEACKMLRKSKTQFQALRKKGRIRYFQDGKSIRVWRSDVIKHINQNMKNGPGRLLYWFTVIYPFLQDFDWQIGFPA